jgi:hypothetical protein
MGDSLVSNLTNDRFNVNSFREHTCARVKGIYSSGRIVMETKCANSWCLTPRLHDQGKLFRLDIEIGSQSGKDERKTEYLWLCGECSQVMHPKVEVSGDTVTLRLTKNKEGSSVAATGELLRQAN